MYILLLALMALIGGQELNAAAVAQGPLGGPQIAVIENLQGFVQVARAATPQNKARVAQAGFALATGDAVQTLAGQAQIRFNDASIVTMQPGTAIVISERQVP